MLVKIGNNIWSVSSSDFKKFGSDPHTLKIRAKSAKVVYTQISGEWFRTSGLPKYDDSTAAKPADLKKIHGAYRLSEG